MAWQRPPMGSPCWIEIPAVDVQACKKFYSELFPSWEFKESKSSSAGEKELESFNFAAPSGLGGGIIQYAASCKENAELKNGVGVTVYHFVESIDKIKLRVEELGGTTCSDKGKAGDHGEWMYFKDVEGNRFGVYEMVAEGGGQ